MTKKETEKMFDLIAGMGKELNALKEQVNSISKEEVVLDEPVTSIELEVGFLSGSQLNKEEQQLEMAKIASELKELMARHSVNDMSFKYLRP